MSDTNKMTYDPIPVGGPFSPMTPEAKPAFSRTSSEPVSTGGLLPPSRKPVSVSSAETPLPPGIAPETPPTLKPTPPAGGGVTSLIWDVLKPTRAKGAVAAGLLSLGAGAYGLNMVVPQTSTPPAKVMSEPGKETTTARVPSMTLERGSAPMVEQVRQEPIVLASATQSGSDLPRPAPMKMPELPPIKSDTTLPLVAPAGDIPLPKSDIALPAAAPLPPISELPKPVGDVLPVTPAPKPLDMLPLAAPTETVPTLPKVEPKQDLVIKPAPTADAFKPVSDVSLPPVTPKLDDVKFTAPAVAAAAVSTPKALKAETVATPRTDYDEDIVRVRSGDTYASLAKIHYEDDKYAAALKEYNRGIDIGMTREIQVPPLYVLKKLSKSSFDQFEPATRPVSATSPIISGPVLDSPVVKPDNDLDWNKPGTPKRESKSSTFTTDRDGLTPKQLAKQLLGDAGEWRKLTDARGQRFGEEEGLPKGTEVRYPKLQADWR
jgi:hypothetical protein